MTRDTIFALATGAARSAVAVVRASGADAETILVRLAGALPAPRRASLRRLRDPAGEVLDQALVLWLPGPASYTGEDSFELHVHGGPAVVRACEDALSAAGARPAEPGEFTRRAFENGRMDLTQAEGVADLVDAETDAQRHQALEQLEGGLSHRYAAWRKALMDALALLEAQIDFPDEDLPDSLLLEADHRLAALAAALQVALGQADRGEQIRDGWRVALIGAPNAGKSTLFNALIARDAAIVTPIAGTTRDVLEASLVLGGYKVVLADTAGVRETGDVIEAEGVRRARAWAGSAARRLWVVDAAADTGAWREGLDLLAAGDFLVLTKLDLDRGEAAEGARAVAAEFGLHVLTTAPGDVREVRAALEQAALADLSGAEFPAATRRRHRTRLQDALAAVQRARLAPAPELASEDLRLAAAALGKVAGAIDAEDVLDAVFGSFCIGK